MATPIFDWSTGILKALQIVLNGVTISPTVFAQNPFAIPAANNYLPISYAPQFAKNNMVNNTGYFIPFGVGNTVTVSEMGFNMTAIQTGGTPGTYGRVRLGIYANDGGPPNPAPKTLIGEAGTTGVSVITPATTGYTSITGLSIVLPSGGVYWACLSWQTDYTGSPTPPNVNGTQQSYIPLCTTTASVAYGGNIPGYLTSGGAITGALPATITPAFTGGSMPLPTVRC